jgi:hypothetical protein
MAKLFDTISRNFTPLVKYKRSIKYNNQLSIILITIQNNPKNFIKKIVKTIKKNGEVNL